MVRRFLLPVAFEILRSNEIAGVVSFSDPLPRRTVTGETIFLGHVGTIYQASNGIYLGRGTARTLHLLPDCRVFSDRAAQKIRRGERGWRYAAAQLERFGARVRCRIVRARLTMAKGFASGANHDCPAIKAITSTLGRSVGQFVGPFLSHFHIQSHWM